MANTISGKSTYGVRNQTIKLFNSKWGISDSLKVMLSDIAFSYSEEILTWLLYNNIRQVVNGVEGYLDVMEYINPRYDPLPDSVFNVMVENNYEPKQLEIVNTFIGLRTKKFDLLPMLVVEFLFTAIIKNVNLNEWVRSGHLKYDGESLEYLLAVRGIELKREYEKFQQDKYRHWLYKTDFFKKYSGVTVTNPNVTLFDVEPYVVKLLPNYFELVKGYIEGTRVKTYLEEIPM